MPSPILEHIVEEGQDEARLDGYDGRERVTLTGDRSAIMSDIQWIELLDLP